MVMKINMGVDYEAEGSLEPVVRESLSKVTFSILNYET